MKKALFAAAFLVCLLPQVSSGVALLAGILLGALVGIPFDTKTTKKFQTYLLQGSVVALGAGMNFVQVLSVGAHSIPSTLLSLVGVMLAGMALTRFFGLSRNLGLLLSSGTAICGGSAIAAVSPAIQASDEDTSLSLGIVFLLNAVALILFPWVGHHFGLSEKSFGLFAALAIHDTSSVVGAASQYGGEALAIATTTKLVRALWIAPLTLAIVFLNRKNGQAKAQFPKFILFFLVVSALYTAMSSQVWAVPVFGWVYLLGKRGLVGAIFLIGTGFQLKTIKKLGWQAVSASLLLWAFSIALALCQL